MSRPVGKLCGTLLLAGSSLAWAQQYSIYTAAGGAPPSTPVSATSTSIGQTNRVTLDHQGNTYFSAGNAVFKISSGTLTIVAGNSRPGYSGDGGPALAAQLNGPQGLAFDSNGNLYICDSVNNRVRMVNPQGIISTFAGNGTSSETGGIGTFNDGGLAINGLLKLPSGVFADSSGNVFIADTGDNVIRKVTPNGIINTIIGDGYAGYFGDLAPSTVSGGAPSGNPATLAELHAPEDVWLDSSGNIYIADSYNAAIREVYAASNLINTIVGYQGGQGYAGDGDLATSSTVAIFTPFSVVVDSSGNVYFAENGDSRIRKVTASNQIINTIAGTGTAGFTGDGGPATSAELNFPTGIALDSSGNLYIADLLNFRIRKVTGSTISTISGNGVLSYSGDGGPATAAELDNPQAVAVDSSGNLYIADTFNNVIREVSVSGAINTVAGNGTAGYGGDGGAAGSAKLNSPQGVVVDTSGNIYFSDSQNARVRKISGGNITTIAGNGTAGYGGDGASATSAQLNVPIGLALDASNNLYIADFGNNVVRKVSSSGTITTVAGNGSQGYSGDGGAALSARLTGPTGVAVDTHGNLYVADSGNNAVRRVSGGIIATVAGNGLGGYSGDSGPATAAMVGNPNGIAVDSSGNLYISDGSVRVRKVYASNGFITTIAGTGTPGYTGDGGSAPFGTLNRPLGLALLPNGNLYVADSGNNAVRLLTYGGYELTIYGAVNAFSELSGPVTGGEIVVFYGTGLGPANLVINQVGANGLYSTTLAGTTVYFGTYQAPIIYTSAGQVEVVVPYEVSGSTIQAFIQYLGQNSLSFPVALAQSNPGIITLASGLAAAVNIHAGAYSYNSAANPANAGDYVELFLTGTGQTNPPSVDGEPDTGLTACALTPVTVKIGGQSISPEYCGGIPGGLPGVTQVNIQIPSGLTAGLVPVSVTFAGVSSQPGVTIAVSGH